MTFRADLESSTARLTEAENRIGELVLSDPARVAGLTSQKIAEVLGVHPSTVVRFSQKLGYDGFRAMRAQLARDAVSADLGPGQVSRVGRGIESSLADIVGTQMQALPLLLELIPQPAIDAAVETLLAARRVVILGAELLEPLAAFTERKLHLLGVEAVHARGQGSSVAQRLALSSQDDAVLAFAFSEQYEVIAPLLRELEIEDRTVLVTDQATLLSGTLPRHVLTFPRVQVRHGVLVPALVLAYGLEFSIIRLAPERVLAAERRLETLTRAQHTRSRPPRA